jgi:hypothetical protein
LYDWPAVVAAKGEVKSQIGAIKHLKRNYDIRDIEGKLMLFRGL